MSKKPKGEIVEFSDKPEQYQAMGKFVYQFSQLEQAIRYLLSDLLELTPEQFHIVTAPYDFAALCRVVSSLIQSLPYCDEATESEAVDLFNKCLEVNDARVRLVHGTWEDDGAHHVSRATMKQKLYFANTGEITRQTDKAKGCMNRVVKLIDGDPPRWARETRELIRDI